MTTPTGSTETPITGPGRSTVTRQGLDTSLANVAAGLSEYLSPAHDAARLADTLSGITQDQLEADLLYTPEHAYAVKLFGDMITGLLAGWNGAAVTAQDPSMAKHSQTFIGL